MTFHRVKVYIAEDADIERLVVDTYVDAPGPAEALAEVGRRNADYFGYAEMAAGVSSDVNSHRSASIAEHHESQT